MRLVLMPCSPTACSASPAAQVAAPRRRAPHSPIVRMHTAPQQRTLRSRMKEVQSVHARPAPRRCCSAPAWWCACRASAAVAAAAAPPAAAPRPSLRLPRTTPSKCRCHAPCWRSTASSTTQSAATSCAWTTSPTSAFACRAQRTRHGHRGRAPAQRVAAAAAAAPAPWAGASRRSC